MNKNERLGNLLLVKALEETDMDIAIKVVSDPELDRKQLSGVIQDSISQKYKSKSTGEPISLNKKILMAGMLNIFKQMESEQKKEV